MMLSFPDPTFAWVFVGILFALLCVAAQIDFRTLKVPKSVVFVILGVGVLANVLRGSWMGTQDHSVFLFGRGAWWLGFLDGFLFSLVGFLSAFVIMFVLWILRSCGGGDVKLMAALGAWLGPVLFLYTLLVSVGVLILLATGQVALALSAGKTLPVGRHRPGAGANKPPQWRMTYSFPVAVATVLVLLWFCRLDLGLAQPKPMQEARVPTNVR
jgi:prepilin peptidase CpaA